MRDVFNTFDAIVRSIKRKDPKEKKKPLPYLEEYYNVKGSYPSTANIKTTGTSRLVNAVIDGLNEENRLPRFLIVAIDKDIMMDLNSFEYGISKNITALVNWVTRQVDIAVRRKKFQIKAKKLGALGAEADPTIIYIDMIQRPRNLKFTTEKLKSIFSLRYKFNSILHEAIDQQQHRVMSIEACNEVDHYDSAGNLTNKGKIEFWHEVDYLIEEFERNNTKLLPHLHLKKQQQRERPQQYSFNY